MNMKPNIQSNYFYLAWQTAPVETAVSLLCYLLNGVYPGIQVMVTANLIDRGIRIACGGFSYKSVVFCILPYILLLLLKYICGLIEKHAFFCMERKMNLKINLAVVTKKASVSYARVEDPVVQELFERITDEPAAKVMVGFRNLLELAVYILQTISILGVLFAYAPLMAVVLFLIAVPILLIAVRCGAYEYQAYEDFSFHMRRAKNLSSILSGRNVAEERELFSYTDYLDQKWNQEYSDAIRVSTKADVKCISRMKLANILTIVMQVIMMILLLPAVTDKIMTVGIYVSILKAENDLVQKITWKLTEEAKNFEKNRNYRRDYAKLMALEEDKSVLEPKIHGQQVNCIEFRNVSFRYPGKENYVIKDLNMTLYRGRKYAFVGRNGAGKTTIMKLLTGLYDTYEGEILIDGVERRKLDGQRLRSFFTVLYQDFCRYEISVEDHLMLGNEKNAKKRIPQALREVKLEEKIEQLPQKRATMLGKLWENGVNFSGGEWQKLATARCLLGTAPVVVLDEPTAALDPLSETAFHEVQQSFDPGKMLLIVTHRLGAARRADEILVVKDGSICERGSHSALMEKGQTYYEMYETQRSWYDENKG